MHVGIGHVGIGHVGNGLGLLAAVGISVLAAGTAHAWSKSYVVEWFEPAFYYGADHGDSEPGADCPKGTNPELNRRNALKTSYRTWAEIDKLLDPEKPQWTRIGGIRGPNKENVYEQPWVVPDPHMTEVSGKIAYGFNLDGDRKTGFTTPEGSPGIDNAYYKAAGCWMSWRGPTRESHHAKYVNDGMRDGVFSVLVVVSGEGKDPANDPDAKLAFYLSRDKMVKDANGGISPDYSFRVNTDPRYQSVIAARTVNGVVESKEPAELRMHDIETAPFFPPQLKLAQAQLRFEMKPDGTMTGMAGGYRPVVDYYTGWAAAGSTHEAVTRIDIPAYWYALQRNADFKIDKAAAKNDAISTAYRFYMLPAFVIAPDGKTPVARAQLFPGEIDEKLSIRGRTSFGVRAAQGSPAPVAAGGALTRPN